MTKVAAQLNLKRAVARTCVNTERQDGGVGETVARFLHRLVSGAVVRRQGTVETVEASRVQVRNLENDVVETREICDKRRRRNSAVVINHSLNNNNVVVSGRFNLSTVRRTVLDGVLRRVTHTQASELRRRALDQLSLAGDSQPFLALLGVSLASGSGIISKEDEIENICGEIRRAVGNTRLVSDDVITDHDHHCSLQDFDLGQPIAKGCAAVVYSARSRRDQGSSDTGQYPLAIKMMFNYDAESNATSIYRAMQRETVPARHVSLGETCDLTRDMIRLKPHPNIVHMLTVFADQVSLNFFFTLFDHEIFS